ncbi:transcription factor SRM1-like [Nicotiana sylvestris]|uniref:transcription factor SRM1-like n=1 Tax=Nicotiana sylvestris TaxID=4096 RepID=UPI00388C40E2
MSKHLEYIIKSRVPSLQSLINQIMIELEIELSPHRNHIITAPGIKSKTLTLRFYSELFLLGLEKYGKGDWRSISRNFVMTRTPTQVASHAQGHAKKYFIRLNPTNKDRRRSSIHDITSVNNGDVSAPQGSSGKSNKRSIEAPVAPLAVGIYGTTTIGQPVTAPLVSAIDTPVNLSAPTYMSYSIMQHTSAHR